MSVKSLYAISDYFKCLKLMPKNKALKNKTKLNYFAENDQ